VALLTCVYTCAVGVAAQEARPQITPGEKKAPRKKGADPRAVAVVQMTAAGKVTLVPVAILVDGKFYDASAYKGSPVPMALDPGTVYEAEKSGSSAGLFTINSALHSVAANAVNPWIGTGAWVPAGSEVTAPLKADIVPVGIDTTDGPPRLTRDANAVKAAPPVVTAPASNAPPRSSSGSGDEPPRLSKGAGAPPDSPPAAPAPASTPPATPPATPPTASTTPSPDTPAAAPGDSKSKPDDSPPATTSKGPASDSGASEANRPRLRRGKPAGPLPEEEVPGYSKPGATAKAATATGDAKPVVAVAGPVQMIPAISDIAGPAPHSFAFGWLKDEEGERRAQIIAYVKDQVRAYVADRARSRIVPTGPSKTGPVKTGAAAAGTQARKAPVKKGPEPILENVQMAAYDLWGNNQPVFVFSAEAHMPPATGSSAGPNDADLRYPVLLVARIDTYNNLYKIYLGITDKFHLDVTSRLDLVDAVDADGDGRGELLFRQTTDAGTGWVIYRVTPDKLWKLFDSLNPE
jgi:hypothetical protein